MYQGLKEFWNRTIEKSPTVKYMKLAGRKIKDSKVGQYTEKMYSKAGGTLRSLDNYIQTEPRRTNWERRAFWTVLVGSAIFASDINSYLKYDSRHYKVEERIEKQRETVKNLEGLTKQKRFILEEQEKQVKDLTKRVKEEGQLKELQKRLEETLKEQDDSYTKQQKELDNLIEQVNK